jgi:hypothetical protein
MSEMGDLSFVVSDGVLSEDYQIIRSTGVFQSGGWVTSSTVVPGYGVVSVASEEDLESIPEMDRVTGAMVFHSVDRIFLTEQDNSLGDQGYGSGGYGVVIQRVTDIFVWNNTRWRVLHVSPYPNRGFWKAIAVRLAGN